MISNEQLLSSPSFETSQDIHVGHTLVNSNRAGSSILSSSKISIDELDPSIVSSDNYLDELNDRLDAAIGNIADEFRIEKDTAEHLQQLHHFKIVIVCDDSGSMSTPVDRTMRTRWDELCEIVKIVIRIGVIFDPNGLDIYFLNRESYQNVRDPKTVNKAFEKPPRGHTPLVPVLNKIFTSELASRERDKKLLVFVATDGTPTDNDGNNDFDAFKNSMEKVRQNDTTFVSFLLCTDEPDCVKYMRHWDMDMKNVDVTDDFLSESARIRDCGKYQNMDFPYGDYIVKVLVGAIDSEIDGIDEPIESNEAIPTL